MGSLSTMERMLESSKNGEENPKEFPPPPLPCRPLGKARRLPSYVTRFQSHSSQARVSLDRVSLKVLVTEDSEIGEEKVSNGVEDSEIVEEKVSNGVEDSEIGEEKVSNGVEDTGIVEEEVSNGVEDSEIGEEEVSNGEEDSEIVEERVSNGLGVISLMDEDSVISQGIDLTLVNKLKHHLCGKFCFKEDKGRLFSLRHCAGQVVYDATGFLETNRDSVHSDLLLLLSSLLLLFALNNRDSVHSDLLLLLSSLMLLFALNICKEARRFRGSLGKLNGTECKRPCTATKFKGQLFKLLHSVENTSQHFICCIKPNRLQLLGVFDVVRMSKVAYHIRMTHERYGFLLPQNITTADAPSVCIAILNCSNIPHETYQVGFTKLFLHRGQSSEDAFQQASTLKFQPLFSTDFQNPLLALDAALREKEDENVVLRQRLQQYETKWIEYETKMLSMKEVWQKQILSLQMRLAAATMKNLAADEVLIQQMKYEESALRASDRQASVTWHNLPHDNGEFDLEDTASMGAKTPKSNINSGKVFRHSDSGQNKEYDARRSAVSHLLKEFEQRKHVFNDDAKVLLEVKSGQTEADLYPNGLQKLNSRFKIWKKAFKVRLQETKTALQKLGNTEPSEKTGRKWWGKRVSWLSQCAGIQT